MVTHIHNDVSVGIGLRANHLNYFMEHSPKNRLNWLEIHPENYLFHQKHRKQLKKISEIWPISFHCVSLSLGSERPETEYLAALKHLMDEIQPYFISDHLSWTNLDGYGYNDLYPLPLCESSLHCFSENVDFLQDFFHRQLLIENPSTYVTFQEDTYKEYEFLNELSHITGCGILLDINNLYVQSINHGWDVTEYLHHLNWAHVKEIHLAGHVRSEESLLLMDTHNQPVCDEVWSLYQQVLKLQPNIPTVIEWDRDLPDITTLLAEAKKAALIQETTIHV